MNRRALLAGIGTVVAGGLAGCIDDGAGGGDTGGDNEELPGWNETDGGETEPGETPTEIREAETRLTDASLTVVDVECGEEHDEAAVEFDHGGEVVVEGTIWGSNLCKIPELVETNYDADGEKLTVTVGTTERGDGDQACPECIAELDYRVTAAFDGGLPESVGVVHEQRDSYSVVTTASN